jgi:hypothetical protein
MRAVLGVIIVMTSSSCYEQWYRDLALETFVKAHTCPSGRVRVKARADLKASQFLPPPVAPPPEVAADPERKALWDAVQLKRANDVDDRYSMYEVEGCGIREVLACNARTKAPSCHRDDVQLAPTRDPQ